MPIDNKKDVVDEFRATGGPTESARLVLLTTADADTGEPATTTVGYLPDEDGQLLLVASAPDGSDFPSWYRDLLTAPGVTVETGAFTFQAEATPLTGEQHQAVFARLAEADPALTADRAVRGAPLPVVRLRVTSGGPRAASWGTGLKLVHDGFRRELALIRQEVATSGPGIGAQLRINCLVLCGGLNHHHRQEDGVVFPGVQQARPDLAPVLARLQTQHEQMQRLLDELQELVSAEGADRATVLAGVERLTRDVEAHLDYEEEQLIPVLDALTPQG